ncbi:MAG: hypothetical protein EOP06_30380 [Proteobacteria bacterium]|nr:MAG: hypothetical protein EOP06_30380 [Pseudomonadota bacterium]
MKSTILSLVVAILLPAVSSAKVEDFNAMITENAKSQTALHDDLKTQITGTRNAQLNGPRKEIVAVASDWKSTNSPTKKSMLTFQKEMVDYRPSETKQMQRLAAEMKEMDSY